MGETTGIAWTDHTFNPWMGCSKVSAACDNCYAEALGKRTGRVQWGDDAVRVVTKPAYWKNPIRWNAAALAEGRPHRVFCASLADVFEDRADLVEPRGWLFDLILETPWLVWQLLTKRPENVLGMVPWERWPDNVWIGTSVENQDAADQRVPVLLEIPAYARFLSCEPLLGRVDLTSIQTYLNCLDPSDTGHETNGPEGYRSGPTIDWVIVGGESGPGHRTLNLEAAQSLRNQCRMYGVPFFFKQVGGQFPSSGGDLLLGSKIKEFPKIAPIVDDEFGISLWPCEHASLLGDRCTMCGKWWG